MLTKTRKFYQTILLIILTKTISYHFNHFNMYYVAKKLNNQIIIKNPSEEIGIVSICATEYRFLIEWNRAEQYRVVHPTATRQEPGLPSDMNFKHLWAKTSEEIEAEYDLLNMYFKSNFTTDVALMPQNKFKNRYINTLPCKTRKFSDLIILHKLTQRVGLVV